RRCVRCIIEKNKTRASTFCKKFKKIYQLFTFKAQRSFLSQTLIKLKSPAFSYLMLYTIKAII
ncbi:hypothetical protein, partial [Haemophilus parahaemolyticus]|uniref:hypothetical protein n=1 Tax=Haemophilus parahaemolyticus TaxID=735 RepID=UPI0028E535E7